LDHHISPECTLIPFTKKKNFNFIKKDIRDVKKKDIVSPGHVFPIISKEGGVLVRAGHTEASVDISKLANKNSSAVICEIMNDKGIMAKGNELFAFSKKHNLRIGKINDLIVFSTMALASLSAGISLSLTSWQTLNLLCLPFLAIIALVIWSADRMETSKNL